MIELRYIDEFTCPVVICDRCGDQITNGRGNVEWRLTPDDLSSPRGSYRMVHKPFDCRVSDTRAERVEWFLSQELDHFFGYLVLNTKIDMDEADRRLRALAEMGL